ncbi:putative leucine-rich repeat-containing protein DDB_G0290503 [Euwallacea similis]|uniref:putative leucine-rich repeat-containing protein DDB_G0290503 n=1 Tax=Euwallacea similis TaxID=1736056 RepID=UPI00344BE7FD
MNDKDKELNKTIEALQTVLKGIASRLDKLEIQVNSNETHSENNKTSSEDLNVERHELQIDQDTLSKILQITTKMKDKEVQLNNTIDVQQAIFKDITSRLEKLEIQVNSSGRHSKTNQTSSEELNIERHGLQIDQDTLSKILQISADMNNKYVQLNNTIEAQQTVLKGIASRLEKVELPVNSSRTHSKLNQTFSEDINVESHGSQSNNNTLNKIRELGKKIDKSSSYINDTLTAIQSSVKIISSRLEHMEQQAKFPKNNQTSPEESTMLKSFIFSMNSLTNRIEAENRSELQEVKEELRLLKSTEGSTHNGIWGEIILDLLLFAILSALLYSLYIIVIRKTTITREEVNLVQTL